MYSICPQCLSPRMHQTSNNMYIPNRYGRLRVILIACGLKAPKRHGKTRGFLSICILLILPFVIINNKDLLKQHGWLSTFIHKDDWNNLFFLNTEALFCVREPPRTFGNKLLETRTLANHSSPSGKRYRKFANTNVS